MNILLTGAGRRNFLVQFFRDALAGRGQVIACDSSGSAPALAVADRHMVVPRMDAPDYCGAILEICRHHSVRLIVSVNDLEIPVLAEHAARFREVGAIPVVPSPEIVRMCLDKWASFLWLRERGIQTPNTCPTLDGANAALARGDLRFPLLIKPRWGTSSIGIETVENERELELAFAWSKIRLHRTAPGLLAQTDPDRAFVIQERLEGLEYGLDVVNDLQGIHRATLARRKLVMRAGNTDRAISVVDPALERLGATLGLHLAHLGSCDCDVLVTGQGSFVLDINPRLGGGYPFSHMAGANLPAALIAWADDAEPDAAGLRCQPGIVSVKSDRLTLAAPEPQGRPKSDGKPEPGKE